MCRCSPARPNPMKLVDISVRRPDPGVVEAAERLLERVKSGEITSIAWVSTLPDGGFSAGYYRASEEAHSPLSAGISALGYMYNRDLIEND